MLSLPVMSPHAWSTNDTFELIRLYKENAPLWDTKHEDYRNRELKGKIISDIATRMNVAGEEINRKLHNLRNQVSQELNKLKKKRNKSSKDEIPISSWLYFSALKFLIPSVINRSKSSDVTIQEILEKECSEGKARSNEVENQETFKRKQDERKGRKRPFKLLDVDDEEESKRSGVSPKTRNEDERFGEWIALELQSLRSEVNKRKLKSEIRRAICHIADLDNADIFVPSTSSNSSPLHSPPSPAYTPVCEIKSENV